MLSLLLNGILPLVQMVLAGVKRGLSPAEAESAMRKAAADAAAGYAHISEVEKDFTSQVSRRARDERCNTHMPFIYMPCMAFID